ncbi:MAG: ABC transporter ATP-binding protein [Verrucomicrobiae bacterium]|nr:ABC transporter ATP-binding protein [Verrucomicrobiae bacterium]
MARIELKALEHRYPSSRKEKDAFAIEDLNIVWEDGTANALLGPSGCGKTTLLNIISGLLRPTGGSVLFDGVRVNDRPTRERHIAQVFQFPVVYDTMTVFDNLAFPLRNQGQEDQVVKARTSEILELLELDDLAQVKAARLNPAEKQIVSLGRGIVRTDTAAVLLDEPLTVIDPILRLDLRRKLKVVQQELKLTMIYVTHDQHEALTFADQVTIMKDGEVVQSAAPEALFLRPRTPFVGYFIGSPGINIIPWERTASGLEPGEERLKVDQAITAKAGNLEGAITLGIRPQFVETRAEETLGWNRFSVQAVDHAGAYQILTLGSGSLEIKANVDEYSMVKAGDPLWVNFPADKINIYQDGILVKP